jgi:hypothetical protein
MNNPDDPDTWYRNGPVRILMESGVWLIPECERPANWREREIPVPYSPATNRAGAYGIHRWRNPSKRAGAKESAREPQCLT